MSRFEKYIILAFFLLNLYASSQVHDKIWYDADNGLTQNSIKDLVKDKDGFVWIATENGILRYDGYSFVTYNRFRIKNQMFKNFFNRNSADSIYIDNAYEGEVVFIHKRRASVSVHNTKKWHNESFRKVNYHHYFKKDLASNVDERINFFIRTNSGTYFIRNGELSYRDFITKNECSISHSFFLKNLNRAFTIDDSLFFLDQKAYINKGKLKYFSTDAVFYKKNTKLYWSQVNNQVFIIDGDDIYRISFSDNHLSANKIMTYKNFWKQNFNVLFYDHHYNKLFLGSSTKGLCIVGFPQMKVVKSDLDKGGHVFYANIPFSENSIMSPHGIEYNHHGLVKDWAFASKSDKYNMIEDSKSNILVKYSDKLYMLSKESNFQKIKTYVFDTEIGNMSRDGDLYFLSFINNNYTGDLRVYENADYSNAKYHFFFKTTVNDIVRLNSSTLLVGCRDGLYTANLVTKKTKKINKINDFFVRNIIQSKEGNFWILTHGQGFYLYKKNAITKLPLDPKNFLLNAHCIVEDKHGYFWISSNNGLFKVSKEQLLTYYKDQSTKIIYYRYSTKDGFLTNEFNGGCTPCGNMLKNGEITFPSLDGVVFFDPAKVTAFLPKHGIYIERAVVDGKEVFFNNTLKLDNNFSRADLFIDLPYFDDSENIYLEAKLNNDKWEYLKKDRNFSINNLSYGHYTLYIRLKNVDGQSFYKKVEIIVPPLFYETQWFRAACLLALIFLIYISFRLRMKFLKDRNLLLEKTVHERTRELKETIANVMRVKEKLKKEVIQQQKLVGTISHDITTPIKYLSIVTKDLYETSADNYIMKKEYLAAIYKSARQLYDFTITLKEYAELYSEEQNVFEPESYRLYDIIEKKKLLFETLLKNDVKIYNKIQRDFYCSINKKVLSVIIHNLLDNAVKNTSKGEIVLSASTIGENITLSINDTGVGMNDEQISYYNSLLNNEDSTKLMLQKFGMGLHLVMQMLAMINSDIFFEKNKPKGTRIKLTLKTHNEDENNFTY